jgi:hypothetical protein
MMVSEEDLDRLDSIFLALMCKKLSQDESQDPNIRGVARNLMEEWMVLSERGVPPSLKEFEQIQKELAELKKRMIKFVVPFVA